MRLEQFTVPVIRQVLKRPRLTAAVFSRMRWGNLFGEAQLRDPYENYDRYIADGYVTYHATYQSWFVMGYDEARAVLSSASAGVGDRFEQLMDIRPYNKLSLQSQGDITNWLLAVDPPDHARLRRLVSRTFTPRRIAEMAPRIDAVAGELLTAMATNDTPDVLAGFAAPLPIYAIGDILGLPRERWDWLREISDSVVDVLDPFRGFDPAEMDLRLHELSSYILELAAERRSRPQNDLLSALVEAGDDGDELSERELVAMVEFLMMAGHETTTGAICNSLLALDRFPDEQVRLRNEPELIDNAVEELLRFETSVLADPRMALEDTVVGGVTIPKGAAIVLLLGIANRDKRRFADADQLCLDRVDPKPLSFGHGIHHCLGAALARLELRIAITRFLEAFPDYRIDQDQIEWKPSTVFRRPTKMPVSVSFS